MSRVGVPLPFRGPSARVRGALAASVVETLSEMRFRQRYLDLMCNPYVREIFIKQAHGIHSFENIWTKTAFSKLKLQ